MFARCIVFSQGRDDARRERRHYFWHRVCINLIGCACKIQNSIRSVAAVQKNNSIYISPSSLVLCCFVSMYIDIRIFTFSGVRNVKKIWFHISTFWLITRHLGCTIYYDYDYMLVSASMLTPTHSGPHSVAPRSAPAPPFSFSFSIFFFHSSAMCSLASLQKQRASKHLPFFSFSPLRHAT